MCLRKSSISTRRTGTSTSPSGLDTTVGAARSSGFLEGSPAAVPLFMTDPDELHVDKGSESFDHLPNPNPHGSFAKEGGLEPTQERADKRIVVEVFRKCCSKMCGAN